MPRRSTVRTRQRDERRGARERILEACRELLEERGWGDIPLEELMARAGLTRTAFYRHFDDRDQLLLALLDEIGAELGATADPWQQASGEPVEHVEDGLANLTAVFERHGRLLRALADTATHDPVVGERYAALGDGFVAAAERRIRADIAAGSATLDDPHEVARALVWMNERYLSQTFGRRPFATDAATATAALTVVWRRTLYGDA